MSKKTGHPLRRVKVNSARCQSVLLRRRLVAFALVDLPVSPQIRDDGEMATTALNLASEWLLARVAVHVGLQRAWARESLIADFALVLLLRT